MELVKATTRSWYVLECTYHERMVAKDAGFWWNTRTCPQKWATKDSEVAYKVREYATPEICAELESIVSGNIASIKASKATSAEVAIPCPANLAYLPYQRAGIAYAIERTGTLIGDEMGLGKTIQSLGVVNATNPTNVLVICPASLRLNWLRESQKWLVDSREYYLVDSKDPIPKNANFVICNYDRLKNDGLDRNWDLLIVDECHKVKNPKAIRTKRVLGTPPKKNTPRVAGIVDRCKRALFLSGTPILNRPVELFPLLSALDPDDLGKNFFGYAKRYCDAFNNGYGWDFSGASNLPELQKRLRQNVMVRRLKKEVLKDLPAKRRSLVALPPNGCANIVKQESQLWHALEASIQAAKTERDLAWARGDSVGYENAVENLQRASSIAFTEISKARHKLALAKVDVFVEYCIDALESTDKIVVFAHHKDVIEKIMCGLAEYNPQKITGEVSTDKRDRSVETFQDDPTCRVIVGSIGAMGVGLTLTAANTVLFAELDFVPANLSQAEDRCHRIGQDNAVSVIHIVLDGSLDQRMVEIILEKQAVIDAALDNDCQQIDTSKLPIIPVTDNIEKPKTEPKYDDLTRELVLCALQSLASACDGARTRDGMGFNKLDTRIGKSLASVGKLTDRQVWLGIKICRKYKKQLTQEWQITLPT